MENIIKVGVGVIVFDEGKVLLGHRVASALDTGGIYEPDSWTLPGGKQEYEETILECAVRETKEETNLDVSQVEVIGASDDLEPGKHYITIHTVAHMYSGNICVMEPDKIDEWRWFDLSNLPENLYSPSRHTIEIFKGRMINNDRY